MDKIKFGIDGWWGIVAKDFTVTNVAKVGYAIARWMTNKFQSSTALIGYDCRFGGEMFMEAIAKILASKGIQVFIAESYVSAPMISLGVVQLKAQCGVAITASHSPAKYNGIKLKGEHGGPILEKDLKDIENLISSDYDFDLEMLNWHYLLEQGKIQYINLEAVYLKQIHDYFDISALNNGRLKFAFDPMYGSTQDVLKKLFPNSKFLHCEHNPSFNGMAPEPVKRNLHELHDLLAGDSSIDCALALDADGDRVALYDKQRDYIDSHRIILLLIHYLAKYKEQRNKVAVSFSCTSKVEKLCAHYGIDVERTKIGFTHISTLLLSENIMVGGEETGGISVGEYLPERDGIWVGLQLWSWLLESEKSLDELLTEVTTITGEFAYDRTDVRLNKKVRTEVFEKCKKGEFTEFGMNLVTKIDDLDGYKFYFSSHEWVLLRASSRYPVIRVYTEAETKERVVTLQNSVVKTLKELEKL